MSDIEKQLRNILSLLFWGACGPGEGVREQRVHNNLMKSNKL